MELTIAVKEVLQDAVDKLKGSDRRTFMAKVVNGLGKGGQRRAEGELGWDRSTIRKGQHELETGLTCVDAFNLRGRKPAEVHLPHLLEDIHDLVDSQSQIDPSFQTQRLYTRLSAAEVRGQLIWKKGYTDLELPTVRTLNSKLNALGYRLKTVAKTKPQKKLPQTDAIFEQLHLVHARSAEDATILRISMDAKASVRVGPFARGGQSRVPVAACDHDFTPRARVTPVGLWLPESKDLFIYLVTSKVTSDCLVDVLADCWGELQLRWPKVRTLQLNLDNGPECHSRRSQFIWRLIQFSHHTALDIDLCYYPPYHSKYNPIERCWAGLENHWNGSLLDSVPTVVAYAKTLKWSGKHPLVKVVTKTYHTGVKLSKQAMKACEARLERLAGLAKWFVKIRPYSKQVFEVWISKRSWLPDWQPWLANIQPQLE